MCHISVAIWRALPAMCRFAASYPKQQPQQLLLLQPYLPAWSDKQTLMAKRRNVLKQRRMVMLLLDMV